MSGIFNKHTPTLRLFKNLLLVASLWNRCDKKIEYCATRTVKHTVVLIGAAVPGSSKTATTQGAPTRSRELKVNLQVGKP